MKWVALAIYLVGSHNGVKHWQNPEHYDTEAECRQAALVELQDVIDRVRWWDCIKIETE